MEIKQGRKIFFPSNDLRQAADAIQSLLNNTVDEDSKKFPIPKYVTREYILEFIAASVNALIMQGENQLIQDNFMEKMRKTQ